MRPGRAPALRLYGIVAVPPSNGMALPAGVQLVAFRDIAAVVTEMPPGRRTPAPPDLDECRAVVAGIFSHCAIIPAPPGVVFRNRDALLSWLDLHHATLCDGVAHVEGRVEARVHVRMAARGSGAGHQAGGAEPRGAEELDSVATELFHLLGENLPAWIANGRAGPGTPHLHRSPTLATADTTGSDSPAAPDGRQRDTAASGDVPEVSASFLVDRPRWRAFTDAVAMAARRHSGFDVELTGPWPPYDFVRLQFGG